MILIAGAGIGGLTLGCALSRAGIPFRIFERAPELRPIGAGIVIAANALQALEHIGLDQPVRQCGWELSHAELCEPSGKVLMRARTADFAPSPPSAMPRSALQKTLLQFLGAPVETGQPIASYQTLENGVRVRFANGNSIDADLLVGADGLRSAVRVAMRGEEPLRFSGQTCWRGLIEGVPLAEPARVVETWGVQERFGIVPVGPNLIYWFAVAKAPAGERDEGDPRERPQKTFRDWHPPIDDLLANTPPDHIIRTDLFDRPPISSWTDGRAVLLGDAAHPMTPNLGQGACQAIEDAIVLANAIHRQPTLEKALTHYEHRRLARANSFVTRSHRFGQIAHWENPALRWLRNSAIRSFRHLPRQLLARFAARDFQFRL